jgi:hypothetical protein
MAGRAGRERLQPARRHPHVVVDERDQGRTGLSQPGVARRVEPAPLAVRQVADTRPRRDDLRGRVGRAVIDSDDLVGDPAALREQRVERYLEVRRAAARGDHD